MNNTAKLYKTLLLSKAIEMFDRSNCSGEKIKEQGTNNIIQNIKGNVYAYEGCISIRKSNPPHRFSRVHRLQPRFVAIENKFADSHNRHRQYERLLRR